MQIRPVTNRRITAAIVSALLSVTLVMAVSQVALAACPQGATYLGPCEAELTTQGCCSNAYTVRWCEGGSACEYDCMGNTGMGGSATQGSGTTGYCEVSSFPGTCNAEYESAVCALDSYCCNYSWDDVCVQQAVEICVSQIDPQCADIMYYLENMTVCMAYELVCGSSESELCDCPAAGSVTTTASNCGWQSSAQYYDCVATPLGDPSGQFPMVCPAEETGCDCSGKQCGSDGCGGSCGSCASGYQCNAYGYCEIQACEPNCAGATCGSDGCGGVCGYCGVSEICSAGQCLSQCEPQCWGKECGSDGCGGSCGSCFYGSTCSVYGECVDDCTPSCAGKVCGDDGCGGTCGSCGWDYSCISGQCIADESCVPDCYGAECGNDGCGGYCGSCSAGWICQAGTCVDTCIPQCTGKQCGSDGCGGVCGECAQGFGCTVEGQCDPCTPYCGTRECGDDGCGGSCGECEEGLVCEAGLGECVWGQADEDDGAMDGVNSEGTTTGVNIHDDESCSCENRECGDDGCGQSCGTCSPGSLCDESVGHCYGVSVEAPPARGAVCDFDEVWDQMLGECVWAGEMTRTEMQAGQEEGAVQGTGCQGGAIPFRHWLILSLIAALFVGWRRRQFPIKT